MTCDDYREAMSEYVERAPQDASARAALERHLATCETCRSLEADLRSIRAAAATLEQATPPADAWARISSRLAAEPPAAGASRAPVRRWLAVAALIVLVAGGGWLALRVTRAPRATTAAATAAAPASSQSVEHELRLAEQHYENAIAGLEQIAKEGGQDLDPATAAVLQSNLRVIDDAIGQSRAALAEQPASAVAQESLFDAMKNKVALLQDTISLINEMRKGNQEGAARIVQGLAR